MAVVKDTGEIGTVAELRQAFAGGISAGSAAAFLAALDAGLGWEDATTAVSAGLAVRYAPDQSPPPNIRRASFSLSAILGALVAYVLLRPVLGSGHELTVAALASSLHLVIGCGVWEPVIQFLGLDPIYAGAAIRAAGGVQVTGFAVAGPIGAALHAVIPAVFLARDHVASGAGVSMVATPGAPALGRGLAEFGADVIWLVIGLWLFWSWRRRRWPIALIGLLIQAQIGVNHLLGARIALANLDASGLPFAIQVAVPNGGWFTTGLASLPNGVATTVMGASVLVLGYVGAGLVLAFLSAPGRLRRRSIQQRLDPQRTGLTRRTIAVAGPIVALVTACSPIGALALGSSNWQPVSERTGLDTRSVPRLAGGRRHSLRLSGATPVSIVHQSDGSWRYVVDGTPDAIRGVGYNPWYATLPTTQRRPLYERDFSAMHQLGINTIEGWFEGQFDSVTLDAAARNGLGVLMPFELNQDWDYTDAAVRAGILDRVSAYVEEYRDHPAVRMWAPGNENLHRILYAHWLSQANVPAARAKAQAIADFLPVLVDRIHELDPNHPVVYRDAEDVYLPWVTHAFEQSGDDRPWLVYGANVYSTQRLDDIISNWPTQWPGRPLLISEFAPGGVGPGGRPVGFEQQWQAIRSRPDVVLGGIAYTWASNGPEDLDRVFGLVDANAVPTDGALAALSGAYLADGGVTAVSPTDQ